MSYIIYQMSYIICHISHIMYYILLYYIILYYIKLYYFSSFYIILVYIILFYIILYYFISFYIILFILSYIILYHIILCIYILYMNMNIYYIQTMHVATSVSPLVRPHRQMRRGVRSGSKRFSARQRVATSRCGSGKFPRDWEKETWKIENIFVWKVGNWRHPINILKCLKTKIWKSEWQKSCTSW